MRSKFYQAMRNYSLRLSHGLLPIFIFVSPLITTSEASAQYLSDTDAQIKAASDRNTTKQQKISAVVGKVFWYRPGTSDSLRTEFYERVGQMRVGSTVLDIIEFTGKFYLTKETSFKVLEADFKKIKIEFLDGKIAFLKAYSLADYGDYSLFKNLYPGRQAANNFQSYIYPDAPFKIENPALFAALDSIVGKRFWYRPVPDASVKLTFVGELKSETALLIESYAVAQDTIDVKVRLDDGTIAELKIEKSVFTGSSGPDLPFLYIGKDKYSTTKEYLYPSPPTEVIAAEEAARIAASEERGRIRKDALTTLTRELKGTPKGFEARGLNFGVDHYEDIRQTKGFASDKGSGVEGFPDVRKEVLTDGGKLYFYRDILFMAIFEDLQDTLEVRAAMNQLESKFKAKFVSIPHQKTRDGNVETTSGGFRMNIGSFGAAEVRLASTRPVNRTTCINDIAREMRQRISLGLENYSSLPDRVESECRETLNPTQVVLTNKPIESIVNSRASADRLRNAREAAEEKLKAAGEKAKKFLY